MPKKIFTQELEGTRRRGRSRKRWKEEVERDLQVLGLRRWSELVADRKKMEGHFSTGQSPQWTVVLMEEEEEEEEEEEAEVNNTFWAVNRLNEKPRNYNILIVRRFQNSYTELVVLTLTRKQV